MKLNTIIIYFLFIITTACNNKRKDSQININDKVAVDLYEDLAYEIRRNYVYENLDEFDSLLELIDNIYSDSINIRYRNGIAEEHIEWLFIPCNEKPMISSTCEPRIGDLMEKLKIKTIRYVSITGRKSIEIPIIIPDTIGSYNYYFIVTNLFKPLDGNYDSLGNWYINMNDKSQF